MAKLSGKSGKGAKPKKSPKASLKMRGNQVTALQTQNKELAKQLQKTKNKADQAKIKKQIAANNKLIQKNINQGQRFERFNKKQDAKVAKQHTDLQKFKYATLAEQSTAGIAGATGVGAQAVSDRDLISGGAQTTNLTERNPGSNSSNETKVEDLINALGGSYD